MFQMTNHFQREYVFFSQVQLLATPWTVAHQVPLSNEFSRKEYQSGFHSLLQGIFLTQGSNLGLLHCRQILYHLHHQEAPNLTSVLFLCKHYYRKLHC